VARPKRLMGKKILAMPRPNSLVPSR